MEQELEPLFPVLDNQQNKGLIFVGNKTNINSKENDSMEMEFACDSQEKCEFGSNRVNVNFHVP